ncbi:hypothetical protein Taro_037488 [Colocasia esculenta]|uniref:Uncharacterized protein n=1 Tax=Colocasia esculenta TaxID=4460 RepID=A0A843W4B3_COLES|nr:hypothetical protein [Colocasia esculenta]
MLFRGRKTFVSHSKIEIPAGDLPVSKNSVPGPKFHHGACVLVHRLSYPLGKTQIFVRAAIRTARESPIRNRNFEPVIRRRFGVEKPSFRTPKLRFRPTISPFPRFSHCNVSLNHVNPGRGNHTESAYHGDRKLCSTRRENCSPGGATTRIRPVTTIGSCVQLGARTPPQPRIPCRRQHRWPPTTDWRQAPLTLTQTDVHLPGRLHAVGGMVAGRQYRFPGLRNYPENIAH